MAFLRESTIARSTPEKGH